MRGQTLVFSDLPLVMNFVTGEAEGRDVARRRARAPAVLIAKLLLDQASDLNHRRLLDHAA